MQVDIENLPDLRLAAVRHIGPYADIKHAFVRLGWLAGPAGLLEGPSAVMIALYHDDPEVTPPEVLRSNATVSVTEHDVMPSGLEEVRVPGGRYARHAHIGGFDVIGDVWRRFLAEGVPASGHVRAGGPMLEIYRSDLRTTPRDEVQTDLLVRVRD